VELVTCNMGNLNCLRASGCGGGNDDDETPDRPRTSDFPSSILELTPPPTPRGSQKRNHEIKKFRKIKICLTNVQSASVLPDKGRASPNPPISITPTAPHGHTLQRPFPANMYLDSPMSETECAINWELRLSDNPIPDDPEQEQPSTATVVRHKSCTAIAAHHVPFDTSQSMPDRIPGVYMVGHHVNKRASQLPAEFTCAPVHDLPFVSHMVCGDGFDIFCDELQDTYLTSGRNQFGQCGAGHFKDIALTTVVSFFKQRGIEIERVCASVSAQTTFWITSKNFIYAHGRNHRGQLGLHKNSSQNQCEPQRLKLLRNMVDIRCAENYTLAMGLLHVDRLLLRWYGHHVQLPTSVVNCIAAFHGYEVYSTAFSVYGGHGHGAGVKNTQRWKRIDCFDKETPITQIATGRYHSLFLDADGVVWSCGDNDHGQCGRPITVDTRRPEPIEHFVANNIKIVEIRCGHYHNLAIDGNGRVWSWGSSRSGQCGHDNFKNVYTPKLIAALNREKIWKIKCGAFHSCVITQHGRTFMFGSNKFAECLNFEPENERLKEPTLISTYFTNIYLGNQQTKWIVAGDMHLNQYL